MKKIYFLLFTFIGLVSYGQSPIITAIVDGDCSGGNPKLLEIYANGTVDFSLYSLENQTNANTTWGNSQDLSTLGTVTNGFVYVTTSGSADALATEFPSIDPTNTVASNTMNLNGDDRVRIVLTADGTVIDQYGVDSVDGTGEAWEYMDSYATRVNGTGPDAGFVASNWSFAGAGALDGLGTCQGGADTFETLIGGVGVYSTTGSTNPSVTITSPSNGATLAPGTTTINIEFSTANLSGGESVTLTVNGTPTTNATSPFAVSTADGQTYTVTADLVNGTGTLATDTITFSVASITQVADLTALRAGTTGELYELTGEVIISYMVTENNRNQKYIQDNGAGILIDDVAGTLTTTFNIGDGLTGLKGQLTEYNGIFQFLPSENLATASSTGNTLNPIVISVSEFLTNGENYESRLIALNNVTFQDTGVFVDNTDYNVADGSDVTVCRATFGDEDLIGSTIPTVVSSITGLGGEFNSTYQILPRYASDIAGPLSVNSYNSNSFNLYPNPTSNGFVNITSKTNEVIQVAVYDILGKQVLNNTVNNNRLNVSTLTSGVYIMKISQNGQTISKKLVVK
ncbi:T9SS type A sorting domain-containing protein [Xanthomarina sp.]|uniref:T9SS type A sorting domain-containing protein n=1 Tax=Xanthomarina sp. TaxID=1931211 RepID=UPI002B50A901|nr:T9SS type A sorting domain-containing protein [Xanthomarina sp.]HLV39447.1 T9SS type A sorting domain-containing protein [Xanthomarina sp.]